MKWQSSRESSRSISRCPKSITRAECAAANCSWQLATGNWEGVVRACGAVGGSVNRALTKINGWSHKIDLVDRWIRGVAGAVGWILMLAYVKAEESQSNNKLNDSSSNNNNNCSSSNNNNGNNKGNSCRSTTIKSKAYFSISNISHKRAKGALVRACCGLLWAWLSVWRERAMHNTILEYGNIEWST